MSYSVAQDSLELQPSAPAPPHVTYVQLITTAVQSHWKQNPRTPSLCFPLRCPSPAQVCLGLSLAKLSVLFHFKVCEAEEGGKGKTVHQPVSLLRGMAEGRGGSYLVSSHSNFVGVESRLLSTFHVHKTETREVR